MSELSVPRAARLAATGLVADRRERRRLTQPHRAPLRDRYVPRVRRPIFVLGAPRSGTSFLGRCVGSLPDVSYHFEPRLTKAVARCVYDGSWRHARASRYFRAYYGALLAAAGHGGLRFAEKDPENCFIVPFLADVFPDSVFLHVIRDGRDVAVSHAEKPWLSATAANAAAGARRGRSGVRWGPSPRFWVEPDRRAEFSAVSDLARSAWMWRRFTENALDHLATLPAERVLQVRYEQVMADPADAASKVGEFLQAAPGALDAAFAQARPDSVGRWRSTVDEKGRADLDQQAGALLARLGYVD